MEIKKLSYRAYEVDGKVVYMDRVWKCTCNIYRIRHTCKHIVRLLNFLSTLSSNNVVEVDDNEQ